MNKRRQNCLLRFLIEVKPYYLALRAAAVVPLSRFSGGSGRTALSLFGRQQSFRSLSLFGQQQSYRSPTLRGGNSRTAHFFLKQSSCKLWDIFVRTFLKSPYRLCPIPLFDTFSLRHYSFIVACIAILRESARFALFVKAARNILFIL